MGLISFGLWFIGSLVAMIFLESTIENIFVSSLIVAAVVAFLGTRD